VPGWAPPYAPALPRRDVGVRPERRRPRRPGAPAREPAGPVPGPAPPRTGADRAGRAVSACPDCSPAVLTGTTAAATATAAARAAGTRCPGTAAARVVARCSHAYSAVLPPTVLLPGSGR